MRSITSFNTFRRRKVVLGISSFHMPKFNFDLSTPLDSATTYSKIKNLLTSENDFKKFDPKVACTFDESSQTCNVKGSQFQAQLQVKAKDSASSTVSINVEVPFALALFKGKIQEVIEKNLKRIL